jgi:MtN3 and saliva related transmembrane protein
MAPLLAVATTVWGVLMALAPLLQLRLMVRRRDASSVSLGWIGVLFVGFVLWLFYGLTISSPPLVITNAVACLTHVGVLVAVLRYRRRHLGTTQPAAE